MLEKIDLHCHSFHSDGSLSPQELIERAVINGVTQLSITDHDSIEAVIELWPLKDKLGLELIAGVEISSSWEGRDVHVVGLNIDHKNPELTNFLKKQQTTRHERSQLLIKKLETRLHIENVRDKLNLITKGQVVCRSHFAQLIVDSGAATSFGKAFSKFLAKGKICAVPSHWPDLEEVVSVIIQAGGIAVLAHPSRYKLSNSRLYQLITSFSASGGKAIEVSYPSIKGQDQRRLIRIANEFDLYGSQGSDFHHPFQTWSDLGQVPIMPADIIPVWTSY